MSQVEESLRSQRASWQEIGARVCTDATREFPQDSPKRIFIFGVGSSYFAARLTAFTLFRDKTRTRVPVISCTSMSIVTEFMPGHGDWAIAISHRGNTPLTMEALALAERMGAFTILIAGQGAPECSFARATIPTVPLEKSDVHTAAITGAICAATTLILGKKALEEWEALASMGNPDLDRMRRIAGNGPTVLVGEREGEWIAREGALKFMELAHLPVRAFGTEEFFHGPHRAISKEDHLWHVSLPSDKRGAEVPAGHRIEVYGSSPLAWVPALIDLQWLALGAALNRELDPDSSVSST